MLDAALDLLGTGRAATAIAAELRAMEDMYG
jgi:hypothetical protein